MVKSKTKHRCNSDLHTMVGFNWLYIIVSQNFTTSANRPALATVYMKILFAASEKFIAPSLLNHTNLLLLFATPSDKISNLLIFMIVSTLIAVELEDKNEETINQLYQYSGCLEK